MLVLDGLQSADSGAGNDSESIQICFPEVQAGIGHGLHAGGDAVVHELVHAPRFLCRQVLFKVEALHSATETTGKGADVEARDRTDAAFARQHIGPGRLHGAAHRRDDAHARDDYTTLAQNAVIRPWRGDR